MKQPVGAHTYLTLGLKGDVEPLPPILDFFARNFDTIEGFDGSDDSLFRIFRCSRAHPEPNPIVLEAIIVYYCVLSQNVSQFV